MKALILLLCLFATFLGATEHRIDTDLLGAAVSSPIGLDWITNFSEAENRAENENKPLFILFTATDWCKNCQALESKIIKAPEFYKQLEGRFIFARIDFLLHTKQSPSLVAQNQALKEQYHVTGFPTIVIRTRQGDDLLFAGSFPQDPEACAKLFLDYSIK